MGRIHNAYEIKFRSLLAQLRARRPDAGVRWLFRRAEARSRETGRPPAETLTEVCRHTRAKVEHWQRRTGRVPVPSADAEPRFRCDAGLGGLARWLRAAGYEARWRPAVHDAELLAEARGSGAIVVTTDSLLLERGVIRDGLIPCVWVPPAFGAPGQLACVLRELNLPLRPPRCMACGGRLRAVDKEAVRDRIPPRTYRWLEAYFVCEGCGRLFWHGTHWERIRAQLASITG